MNTDYVIFAILFAVLGLNEVRKTHKGLLDWALVIALWACFLTSFLKALTTH